MAIIGFRLGCSWVVIRRVEGTAGTLILVKLYEVQFNVEISQLSTSQFGCESCTQVMIMDGCS